MRLRPRVKRLDPVAIAQENKARCFVLLEAMESRVGHEEITGWACVNFANGRCLTRGRDYGLIEWIFENSPPYNGLLEVGLLTKIGSGKSSQFFHKLQIQERTKWQRFSAIRSIFFQANDPDVPEGELSIRGISG